MKRMQYFSLLVTGICLPVFADPVLKVGTFQSKGASLEQPSLVEGNKRVGLRELYGSMFAGQDFKIGVYAGKEEICRIYFLGKFRGRVQFRIARSISFRTSALRSSVSRSLRRGPDGCA